MLAPFPREKNRITDLYIFVSKRPTQARIFAFVGMLKIDPSSSWGYPIPNFRPAPCAQFSWLFQHFKRLQKCHAASVTSHQLRPLLYFCWELWWVVWWAVRHAQFSCPWDHQQTQWNQPPNLLLRPNSLGEWNDHASKRWLGKVHSHHYPSTNFKKCQDSVGEELGC